MRTENDPLHTWSLVTVGLAAGGFMLYWLSAVLVPFVLALMVFMTIRWVVAFLCRMGVPSRLARPVAFALGLAVLALMAAILNTTVGQFQDNLPKYEQGFQHLLESVPDDVPMLNAQLDEMGSQAVGMLFKLMQTVTDAVSSLLIVLVYVVFLLAGGDGEAPKLWREVEEVVQRYIAGKVAVSAVTGLLTGVVLYLLGVDLAAAFGVLAFVLNFVPYVGPAIAILAPVPIALLSPGVSGFEVALVFILPASVQFVVGNFIEPKILGRSLELHPVTVLLTLALFTSLWGLMGMLLATPMTSIIKLLLERSDRTMPLARLMAGDARHMFGQEAASPPT